MSDKEDDDDVTKKEKEKEQPTKKRQPKRESSYYFKLDEEEMQALSELGKKSALEIPKLQVTAEEEGLSEITFKGLAIVF